MAIQFVGSNSANKAGATSGTSTVSLTALTGGISSSAAAGDLVIAVFATGSAADRALTITDGTNNYTLIDSERYANGTSYDSNLRVAYKYLTGADASVTFGPTGNAADGGAMCVSVYRGVDSATPLDVTAQGTQGTGTGRPTPPAITPTTSGAWIVCAGGGAAATGANFTASGLSGFATNNGVDTNDGFAGVGYYSGWTSGQYTPAQWTGGTTNAADSWTAITVALRPFIAVDHATTGTLTGGGATVSGTAAHIAKHATTGDLTGQGASVVGSASRFRAMASSGVLTGQGAAIVGSADRQDAPVAVTHDTDGALVGQGAAVTGAATRFRAHAADGTLTGQGATVEGTAAHLALHTSTGVLVGTGAEIAGSASRFRAHDGSGALIGSGAEIAGDAARSNGPVTHSTSGTLAGGGATVSGAAQRFRAFDASGILVGAGTQLAGSADRIEYVGPVTHDASGALVGSGAALSAAAAHLIRIPLTEATVAAIAAAVWARGLPLDAAPGMAWGDVGLTAAQIDAISHAVWSRSLP